MVYFLSDNIISSIGFSTNENFQSLLNGKVGIKTIYDQSLYPESFPASIVDNLLLTEKFDALNSKGDYTRLEQLLILSVQDALSKTNIDIQSERTGIIISTTKGNIDLLEPHYQNKFDEDRVLLWRLGEVIGNYFKNPNQPIVLSNACVSGVLALNVAASMIRDGKYDTMIVAGGDIVSGFVVSGFMSFLSLSPEPCKPFDANRDGLSLGEGSGTIILGNQASQKNKIALIGGGSANDANHISGPSRNGEGSFIAISKALSESKIKGSDIDHISAHGTATDYNDEMESIAISRAGLENVPVNSFKGNWGHTLGAAGIVETVAMLQEMKESTLIKSTGYQVHGVSMPINVIKENIKTELSTCLKMASGFGGSNASLIAKKIK